jgi:ABC-type nitrate/sulfonate/bicarbonate transport system substrate-binding protein
MQLEPDRDVKIIGAANRLATMQQGLIQGTLLSPPENFAALNLGFKSLGEVAEMGINYSYAGIISSKRFVNENPDSTLRFTRSDIEALPLLLRDRSTAVRIVEKYSRISDRAVLEDAYDLFYVPNADYLPAKRKHRAALRSSLHERWKACQTLAHHTIARP